MRFLKDQIQLLKIALGLGLMAALTVAAGQSASNPSSEELTLQIIVVGSPEEAQHILDRVKKGESFPVLAKEKSIDPTAEEGGLLGRVSLSMLRPELRAALGGVGPGEISPVVRTTLGYAILKVVERGGSSGNTNSGGSSAMAATGSVKYVFNLGGLGEAELGLTKAPKTSDWRQDLRQICATRKQSLAAEKESLQQFLSPANSKARASYEPIDLLNAHYSLGELHSYEGNMDQAVEQYEEAYQIAVSDAPEAVPQMNEALGIAYLHKSEMENDVYRAPGEKCLLPMRPGNAYAKAGDSEKRSAIF
jgi:PPIC-type PPIASE domain